MLEKDLETDRRLGLRLKQARLAKDWSLDDLAARSGVSRGMISRIERAESSPTAALLVRLCAPLECSLSALFASGDRGEAIARHADQPVWRDPETGYVRRAVSPAATDSAIEIAEIVFPAGARITLEQTWRQPGVDQQIWLFSGELVLTIRDVVHHLRAGDCLHLWLDRPLTYFNPGTVPAHYSVIHLPRTGRSP